MGGSGDGPDRHVINLGGDLGGNYTLESRRVLKRIAPTQDLPPTIHDNGKGTQNLRYRGDLEDEYVLGERLAVGGQGLLRRAVRKFDGKEVIFKKYNDMESSQNWDLYLKGEEGAAREIRFLEEANRKRIRGVPTLLEYGLAGGWEQPAAIFDPLPGRNLRIKVLEKGYVPDLEELVRVVDDISEPLEFAHNYSPKQIVHRDVNPENIMANGNYILMDWGSSSVTSGQTQMRTSMMSWGFTAPELWDFTTFDGSFDHRADIYSLGQVLKFMLVGQHFFDSNGEIGSKELSGLKIQKGLINVLEKATAYMPRDRYSSIVEFRSNLESAVRGENLPASQVSPVPKRVTLNRTVKPENVLTLESEEEFSRELTNEVILEQEGRKIKYIAHATELYMDGRNIRGDVSLERYDLANLIRSVPYKIKRFLFSRIPWFPRTETKQVPEQKWVRTWRISDGNGLYFTDNGKPRTELHFFTYRGALKGAAATRGIDLSQELFNLVFGPIDRKNVEMYHKFYKGEK